LYKSEQWEAGSDTDNVKVHQESHETNNIPKKCSSTVQINSRVLLAKVDQVHALPHQKEISKENECSGYLETPPMNGRTLRFNLTGE
jgi:hypothetical protein